MYTEEIRRFKILANDDQFLMDLISELDIVVCFNIMVLIAIRHGIELSKSDLSDLKLVLVEELDTVVNEAYRLITESEAYKKNGKTTSNQHKRTSKRNKCSSTRAKG